MKQVKNMEELRQYDAELEVELQAEGQEMKVLAAAVAAQLRPDNILQELHDQIEKLSSEKGDLLNSTLSAMSGGLGKFIVSGSGETMISRASGNVINGAIRLLAKKYPESTVKFYLKLIGFAMQFVKKRE